MWRRPARFHPLNTRPEVIGVTPAGLKVDWFITGGTVAGPKLNARVRAEGGDWMTIRTDGIGVLGIRATLETSDGALIYTTYSGVFDLGEDGYQNFLEKRWPSTPPVRSAPMFLTAHPKYAWRNRLQCLGVGVVYMDRLLVYAPLEAHLSRMGKGLRPALCMATCRAFGGTEEQALLSADEVGRVLGLMHEYGSIDYARSVVRHFAGATLFEFGRAYGEAPDSEDKAFIRQVIHYMVSRDL